MNKHPTPETAAAILGRRGGLVSRREITEAQQQEMQIANRPPYARGEVRKMLTLGAPLTFGEILKLPQCAALGRGGLRIVLRTMIAGDEVEKTGRKYRPLQKGTST